MEMIGPVVDGQMILLAVEREAPLAYAVAIAPHQSAQKGFWTRHDPLYIVMSLYNIGKVPVSVGHHNRYKGTSVVSNRYFAALAVTQDEEVRPLPLYLLLEV